MEKIILPKHRTTHFSNKEEIIVSSRVCISRNIDGLVFPSYLPPIEREKIEQEFGKILTALDDPLIIFNPIKELTVMQKEELACNLVITDEFKEFGNIFFSYKNGDWILLANEKDHFRIFSIEFGLRLKEIYKQLLNILIYFDNQIHFAFHPEFGYINSFADHSGNGLSLSILLNLCGLELQGKIPELVNTCQEMGYYLHPLTGKKDSKYFYLKNRGSFGISELEHIQHMISLIQKIQKLEISARTDLLKTKEDKEFFTAQILQILSQSSVDYNDATEFIALIEMLKPIYKIINRERWQEQLFRLQNGSSIFLGLNNVKEIDQYRANILNQLFISLVRLK